MWLLLTQLTLKWVQKELDKRQKKTTTSQIWTTLPLTGRSVQSAHAAVHGSITLGVAVGPWRCVADHLLAKMDTNVLSIVKPVDRICACPGQSRCEQNRSHLRSAGPQDSHCGGSGPNFFDEVWVRGSIATMQDATIAGLSSEQPFVARLDD